MNFALIEQSLGKKIIRFQAISGGCTAKSYLVELDNSLKIFVKTHAQKDIFEKEANGLKELEKAQAIIIPKILLVTEEFLCLELLEQVSFSAESYYKLGQGLALLHKFKGQQYGFYEDNYIGTTTQINKYDKNWSHFFYQNRLVYQLKLLEEKRLSTKDLCQGVAQLENIVVKLLDQSQDRPSLLHGDLWSGNVLCTTYGPALIDPAVYYGHREADLAMAALFGGFPLDFYLGYTDEYPLEGGHLERQGIYQLYHVLNHLNLFGRSYYSQAMNIIRTYLE